METRAPFIAPPHDGGPTFEQNGFIVFLKLIKALTAQFQSEGPGRCCLFHWMRVSTALLSDWDPHRDGAHQQPGDSRLLPLAAPLRLSVKRLLLPFLSASQRGRMSTCDQPGRRPRPPLGRGNVFHLHLGHFVKWKPACGARALRGARTNHIAAGAFKQPAILSDFVASFSCFSIFFMMPVKP